MYNSGIIKFSSHLKKHRFSTDNAVGFSSTLLSRVNQYFTDKKLSKTANQEMVFKTISALSLYFIPFIVMLVWQPVHIPILLGLWIIMGMGKAFIGTAVMHDALHGSYSSKNGLNKWLGQTASLLGIDSSNWKTQHNVLHHTFTNIEHADEDIDPRFVFRFSPYQPHKWFHKYQHVYALFFYAISTLIWVFVKDIIKAFRYRNIGLVKSGFHFAKYLTTVIFRKVFYLFVFLVLPILLLPISAFWVIGMFVAMHLTAGVLVSLIFQCAHVMETSVFIDKDTKKIDDSRLVHQLKTTSNFGMQNRFLFWFSGGLNHQIEHHLFPEICHVHYRKISKIVKETAQEFGLPYHSQPTFFKAVIYHFNTLKVLGSGLY